MTFTFADNSDLDAMTMRLDVNEGDFIWSTDIGVEFDRFTLHPMNISLDRTDSANASSESDIGTGGDYAT